MTETTKPPEKMSELIRLAITDGRTPRPGGLRPTRLHLARALEGDLTVARSVWLAR